MPPKSALSAERLRQEAEAQRARAAALQYLTKTSSGPSQRELAQQQRDRERLSNATSLTVQQILAKHLPAVNAGWEEVVDPQTDSTYYWHRETNETTWTKPVKQVVSLEKAREAKSRLDEILKFCGPSSAAKPSRKAEAKDSATSLHKSKAGTSMVIMKSDARTITRPLSAGGGGSVKKQKQVRKQKESQQLKLQEVKDKIAKLEDRDTQQQAFLSLILPNLDAALVAECVAQVERNKRPVRSSARRLLVLFLAALCKCHPSSCGRLVPRLMAYVSLRLRDKEAQITEACIILCAAIALYVVPFVHVNAQGQISPRRRSTATSSEDESKSAGNENEGDDHCKAAFDAVVTPLLRETNAVGEMAAHCVCGMLRPVEFDGESRPPLNLLRRHATRLGPFLEPFTNKLVARLNENNVQQTALFSTTFLMLHAIASLIGDTQDNVLHALLGSHFLDLVDAIEDVFRDAPRDDWTLRRRAIELLTVLLQLFAVGEMATEELALRAVVENVDRLRVIVWEGRHDPVSAVRDAAVPASELFERIVRQRADECVAPVEVDATPDEKPQQSAAGIGILIPKLPVSAIADKRKQEKQRPDESFGIPTRTSLRSRVLQAAAKDDSSVGNSVSGVLFTRTERDTTGSDGKKSEDDENDVPLDNNPSAGDESVPDEKDSEETPEPVLDVDAGHGDEAAAPPMYDDHHQAPNDDARDEESRAIAPSQAAQLVRHQTREAVATTPTAPAQDVAQQREDEDENVSREDLAVAAAQDGRLDVALRLSFLADDINVLKRVLTLAPEPCMATVSRASRSALCAAFLELLDDASDRWLVFPWLQDLVRRPPIIASLDPRVFRALEFRLEQIAEEPTKQGQLAADLLTRLTR
ncbi:hypothetical protein ATCC90586_007822 [Pythium insidiosum]|nr:hypothetical protein ATCC90586_007822 [Pythium insidiosum]